MKIEFFSSTRPQSISEAQWLDWVWQLRHSFKTKEEFEKIFKLTDQEELAFSNGAEVFNIRSTPYYSSLVNLNLIDDPIRRILMPHSSELSGLSKSQKDPLGETQSVNNPVRRIIHRYSDRLLFLVTDICSVYCRYCTRKHFTGLDQALINPKEYQQALDYIKSAKGVREVILSGGDPLTLSDAVLDRILFDLRKIDHLEIIRIGTRMPVVAPMRITKELVQIIRKHKPVFLMTHFNHPRELTDLAAQAIENFVDHGIPVMNQMVLLNGVNNHPALVQALSRRLLFLRAKPYYMFQCDPSPGTEHLRTSIDESLNIQKELWGHLSGLAMPNLSVDIPSGGGKTYYVPHFETQVSTDSRTYVGWDGVEATYFNPDPIFKKSPADVNEYLEEWETLKESKKRSFNDFQNNNNNRDTINDISGLSADAT